MERWMAGMNGAGEHGGGVGKCIQNNIARDFIFSSKCTYNVGQPSCAGIRRWGVTYTPAIVTLAIVGGGRATVMGRNVRQWRIQRDGVRGFSRPL